jgi:uncharacterized protein YciI
MKNLLILICLFGSAGVDAQPKAYTIVFLNHKPDAEKIDKEAQTKLFEGHMANINRLAKEGKLLAAGPFEGGGGLFILNTGSQQEADEWVKTDPAVRANRWNIEILPYAPRIGSVCPASEPYEMVLYTFVRFNAIVEKFTASTYPNLIRQHEAYVKNLIDSSEIITEATFGPNEGGILVLRTDVAPEAFSNDPGVQQGLLDVQVKKLYIARTSFCEK